MDDKRLERIENKLDDTNEHLASIDVTLGVQSIQLRDHIRRTALLGAELKPIKKHVDMVSGAMKLITIVSLLLGVTLAIHQLLK